MTGRELRVVMRASPLLLVTLVLLTTAGTPAQAATITVSGGCTFDNAITAANTDATAGGCPAGSGADAINLPAGAYQPAGALLVSTTIVILGAGARTTIIDGRSAHQVFAVVPGGALDLRDVTVSHGHGANGAPNNPGGDGGGIDNDGTLTVTRAVFADNTAGTGGSSPIGMASRGGDGGAIASTGTLTVTATEFTSNAGGTGGDGTNGAVSGGPGGQGGALAVLGGTVTLLNDTFSANTGGAGGTGNAAPDGGSGQVTTLEMDAGTGTGRHLTVSADPAPDLDIPGGSFTLSSSIDVAGTCVNVTDGGDNFAGSTTCAPAASTISLAPLANNGGPTDTMLPLVGDPEVDAIAVGPDCDVTDQRGFARPQGTACDAGAVELRNPAMTAPAAVAFGSAQVGSASAPDAMTVSVPGTSDLGASTFGLVFAGADPDDFLVTHESCSNTLLAPGGSCQIAVRMLPSAVGARSATLAAQTNPLDAPAFAPIALSGTGTAATGGPQGLPGVDGTNGTNGASGTNGTNGSAGAPGARGPAGAAGKAATVSCKVAKPKKGSPTVKVTCTVRHAGRAVTARLSDGARTLARDTIDRRGITVFRLSAHAAHRVRRIVLSAGGGERVLSAAVALA